MNAASGHHSNATAQATAPRESLELPLNRMTRALDTAAVLARAGHTQQALGAIAQAWAWSPDRQTLAQHLIQGPDASLGRATAFAITSQERRLSGLLRRSLAVPNSANRTNGSAIDPLSQPTPTRWPQPVVPFQQAGTLSQLLAALHQQLQPRLYLEMGIGQGDHLAFAQGPAIGVDPLPRQRLPLGKQIQLITATADEFFAFLADDCLSRAPDLVLLAGLPLADRRLSELLQLEARAAPHTLVAIPGIFPADPERATRRRTGRDWQGDLWKLPPLLRSERPDLHLLTVDLAPAGLLLVTGLDPARRAETALAPSSLETLRSLAPPPAAILQRQGACRPHDRLAQDFLTRLQGQRPQ